MEKGDKQALLKNRLKVLQGRGNKNVKCPGVVRKLSRQLRNMN